MLRLNSKRMWLVIASLAVALLAGVSVSTADPPCGLDCRQAYEACISIPYSYQGYVTQQQMNSCAAFQASCWNNCEGTSYAMCHTVYEYWFMGDYVINQDVGDYFDAQAACPGQLDDPDCFLIHSWGKQNSCW